MMPVVCDRVGDAQLLDDAGRLLLERDDPTWVARLGHAAGQGTIGIEGRVEAAEVLVVPRRGHDGHVVTIGVGGVERILAVDVLGILTRQQLRLVVDEQLIATAGDGDVDARQLRQRLGVGVDALEVADEDDLVDAGGGQGVDTGLDGGHGFGHGHVARRADDGQLVVGGADHTELLAGLGVGDDGRSADDAAVRDRRLDHAVLVDPVGEGGFGAEVEVGRDERLVEAHALAAEAGDVAGQEVGPVVELVVAEDVHVIWHLGLGDGVVHRCVRSGVLGAAAGQHGRGQERVAGVDREHAVALGMRISDLAFGDRLEGGSAADLERDVLAHPVAERGQ